MARLVPIVYYRKDGHDPELDGSSLHEGFAWGGFRACHEDVWFVSVGIIGGDCLHEGCVLMVPEAMLRPVNPVPPSSVAS